MHGDILGYLLLGCGIALFVICLVNALQFRAQYMELKTFEQYIADYPECKTETGIRCFKCKSGSISNLALTKDSSIYRKFVCDHCGEPLYRREIR